MIWFVGVEDRLSFVVSRRIIASITVGEAEVKPIGKMRGNGDLRKNMGKFVELSKRQRVLVVTDLDQSVCAPTLRQTWLAGEAPEGRLAFRVAVREIESWVLADKVRFAEYFGISERKLPDDVDAIIDPKNTLLSICSRIRRETREDIVTVRNGHFVQALNYNERLSDFILNFWNVEAARERSDSLDRACIDIENIG